MKYIPYLLLLIVPLLFCLPNCEGDRPQIKFIDRYRTQIDTLTIYKDKIKVLKTVLKSERKVIIHDTLKCDSLYKLVLMQDTLIQKDSIFITEILHDTLIYYKNQNRIKSFLYGFSAGVIVGKLL